MNNQSNLTAKESHISFHFNDQTSSYESRLTLHNQSEQPLYYRIVSTFGRLLTYQNHISKKVEPKKSIILSLKLKIPNQINKHDENIRVSFSKRQLSSKVQLIDDESFDVKIEFDQTIPEEDEMIAQILKGDCQQLCEEAAQLLKTGFVKKALYKYQESFLLYRKLGKGLYGMAECLYLMQLWHEALQQIETALILHSNQNYQWLKLKIVFEIIKDEPNSLQTIKGLKKQIQNITEVSHVEQKKKQMIEYLTREEDKIVSEKGGKYVAELIQTALAKYDNDPYIKTLYKNITHYERQVLEVLGMKKPHTIEQAPQYILDPITYQIMDQPLIVPSGHSFDKKSLLAYICKHGNKDLFTRQQLRYEWAKPNNALQAYIKKNDHLKQWIEYEREISTFK